MRRAVLLAAVWMLAGMPLAQAEPGEAEIDALVAPEIGVNAPGMAVLVMRKGEVLLAKGYGLADIENEVPVTADTVFDLASVSKQMTALLALKLSLEEKLDLAAPIDDVLPAFRQHEGMRAVSAEDLIHHLSGLADYLAIFTPETTNDEVIEFASATPPLRAPGTKWEYSNTGYAVLASAIAAVHGAEFPDVLRSEIFDPLGMESSAMPVPREGIAPERIAKGYKGENGSFELDFLASQTEGDGSVQATINDLALYEAALAAGTLLPDGNAALPFANGALDDGSPIDTSGKGKAWGYGAGWYLWPEGGRDHAGHGGSWHGASNYYRRDLATGLSVIVLVNVHNYGAEAMAASIAALYEE